MNMTFRIASKKALATLAAALAGLTTLASPALAQGLPAKPIRGFVGFGITGGGDKLATVQYTNGDSVNIKAGGQVDFRAGVDARLGDSPFAVQASIGWFFDRSNADNGNVKFERYPLELLGFWRVADNFRLGGGVRNMLGDATLKGTGAASSIGTIDFKGQLGAVLEGEFVSGPNFGVTLRYVKEEYKAPNGEKVDGSHAGLRLNLYF
jgi:hypothetical protein